MRYNPYLGKTGTSTEQKDSPSQHHLCDSGVGAVGPNDQVELFAVLYALDAAFGVPCEVDLVLTVVLVRRDINLSHQPVDGVRPLQQHKCVKSICYQAVQFRNNQALHLGRLSDHQDENTTTQKKISDLQVFINNKIPLLFLLERFRTKQHAFSRIQKNTQVS